MTTSLPQPQQTSEQLQSQADYIHEIYENILRLERILYEEKTHGI